MHESYSLTCCLRGVVTALTEAGARRRCSPQRSNQGVQCAVGRDTRARIARAAALHSDLQEARPALPAAKSATLPTETVRRCF